MSDEKKLNKSDLFLYINLSVWDWMVEDVDLKDCPAFGALKALAERKSTVVKIIPDTLSRLCLMDVAKSMVKVADRKEKAMESYNEDEHKDVHYKMLKKHLKSTDSLLVRVHHIIDNCRGFKMDEAS